MFSYAHESTVGYCGEAIDSRLVTLAFEFYELSEEKVLELCQDILAWVISASIDSYATAWKLNGRNVSQKHLIDHTCTSITQQGYTSLSANSFVRSQLVNTSSSVRRYISLAQRTICGNANYSSPEYNNFIRYWLDTFPQHKCDTQSITQYIENLFLRKSCSLKAVYSHPDMYLNLSVVHYTNCATLYYGSFSIGISAFCLGDHICEVSDLCCSQLKLLGAKYQKLNGRVMLQPFTIAQGRSPYMDYFGRCRNSDGSHKDADQTPHEWYGTYYLCGIEWANIISPRARVHLPNLLAQATQNSDVVIEELGNGAVFLGIKKHCLDYDIDDAIALKELVIEALHPGGSDFLVSDFVNPRKSLLDWQALPRHDWAIVPILEGEIDTVGTRIIFRSQNFW